MSSAPRATAPAAEAEAEASALVRAGRALTVTKRGDGVREVSSRLQFAR